MIKINEFQLENVKRIKAVSLCPTENGLTIIGGKNGQGKTSVLDAIAWALGGAKFAPTTALREGSVLPPALKITLSNGLVVERTGKNSTLKVTDAQGNKGGQQLLDEFIEELALDLPKFIQASNKEKAQTLLQIIGVGEELAKRIYEYFKEKRNVSFKKNFYHYHLCSDRLFKRFCDHRRYCRESGSRCQIPYFEKDRCQGQ